MKVIVGLGNPGKKYENTRHNIGFMILDKLAQHYNLSFKEDRKFQGEVAILNLDGEKVCLLKPLTYMNESGRSVKLITDYYNISEDDILVIYDDLDLPTSKLRLREQGSSGGHNGIKSIINVVNIKKFKRIKVGISRPQNSNEVVNYVLGKFTKNELELMENTERKSIEIIDNWVQGQEYSKLMNKYN